MKKFFVSAGLAAIGVAGIQSALAEPTSPKYWSVAATLRGFYDSNYNIQNNGQGSSGVEFLPSISLHVPLQQTDVGIRFTYGLYYYQDRQDAGVDPFDMTYQADMWLQHAFNERWNLKVTDTFAVGQEPELLNPNPTSANATVLRANGNNISNQGNIALNTDWTRLFSTTVTYNNGFYDYQNTGATVDSSGNLTPSLAGTLNRIEQNAAIDFKWHIQPETTALFGYAFSWVCYTGNEPIAVVPITTPTFNGVYMSSDRDMRSQYLYLGIEQQFTPNLNGMIRGGANYADVYADPLFPSTSWSPYADISLSYTYRPGSYVQLGFTHDISSTDQVQPNSAGQITQYMNSSVVYLDINHRFTPKLVGTAIGRVQYSTYVGGAASSSNQTDYGLGFNLAYQFNQFLSADVGYNYDNVVGINAFTRNRYYFGLSVSY